MRISADYVRVSITHGISHEDAGEELLEFMRCVARSAASRHHLVAAPHGGVACCRPSVLTSRAVCVSGKCPWRVSERTCGAGSVAVPRTCMCSPVVAHGGCTVYIKIYPPRPVPCRWRLSCIACVGVCHALG